MNLKSIWLTLGDGHQSFPRNLSWTRKGPGRRHSKLSKRLVEAINKARIDGAVIDPNDIIKK
jgi:hypothetical protein